MFKGLTGELQIISSLILEICYFTFKLKLVSMLYLVLPSIIRGYAVAQLVEALRYKSEGRGFDSRWCHWNFSLT